MEKRSDLEVLLHRLRMAKAREEDPESILYAILDEVEAETGYSGRESWNIVVELIADYLGIIKDPWKYSLPGFQNEPYFRGREAFQKQSGKLSDGALKVRDKIGRSGLIEMYVEAARAKPWDHIGEVFMERGLHGSRQGQVLTPRSVVELMVKMTMPEYDKTEGEVWIDYETVLWADNYTKAYGYFPFWARDSIESALKTLEAYVKPHTILDPCVGTGRFLLGATLLFPKAPLVLFGIEIDPSLYRACLVNMALFSRHPYTIICADALMIDEKYAHTTSPIWDMGNLWEPADISPYYWKEPTITSRKFSLADWVKIIQHK